ncbi:MAG: hypothetical protein V1492_03750, partial [Candidatus Micrarchaeota archaeon]
TMRLRNGLTEGPQAALRCRWDSSDSYRSLMRESDLRKGVDASDRLKSGGEAKSSAQVKLPVAIGSVDVMTVFVRLFIYRLSQGDKIADLVTVMTGDMKVEEVKQK